jgi:hypothetical protein
VPRPRVASHDVGEAEAFWTLPRRGRGRQGSGLPADPKGPSWFTAGTVTGPAGGPAGMWARLADGNGAPVGRAGAVRPLPQRL